MSYPHTSEVINALQKKATPESITAAVTLLQQYYALCQTMEHDIETFRAAKLYAEEQKQQAEIIQAQLLVAKDALQVERDQVNDQKNAIILQAEADKQVADAKVADALKEKQEAILTADGEKARLVGEKEETMRELNELKQHPALVAIDENLKLQKIATLEAELAKLKDVSSSSVPTEPKEEPVEPIGDAK